MQRTNLSVACLGCCLGGDVLHEVKICCTTPTVAVRI